MNLRLVLIESDLTIPAAVVSCPEQNYNVLNVCRGSEDWEAGEQVEFVPLSNCGVGVMRQSVPVFGMSKGTNDF